MDFKVIDADGHVIEDESLFDFLDSSYRERDHQLSWDRLFPSLDFHHIGGHSTRNKKSFGGGKRVVSSSAGRRRPEGAPEEAPVAENEPLIKEADPELERLLAEEEEIERRTHEHHETPHFRPGDE